MKTIQEKKALNQNFKKFTQQKKLCEEKIQFFFYVRRVYVAYFHYNGTLANLRELFNMSLWRCPWCNGYCRRKWTRRHEFKS